ncbi:hypothetical protein ABID82_005020 [Methylobacterium sp. PvP062]|uniref:GcrA cell cycle regulator n=1 Tax=Methylobacterium radiotolerans TaxID=31998 RepID=A0ABV2NP52_9HYPH|nr:MULTISPECIES: hypothetical protein [unclassified Methylobacterium]MBP2494995.1 hypothetical protein [Methylobacterium sp. PvP105]MBP2505134.1 hypothetical protein [Methylobacterium sp. PvP109]MCX7336503.1 hypothetical protein [Hyphomicrobiales bacterium]
MAARARQQPAPEPAPAAPPLPAFGTFACLELKDGQCRFPCSSHGGAHRFCGRPIAPRVSGKPSSWCAAHLAVVFEAWRPGGQVLRRAGRV